MILYLFSSNNKQKHFFFPHKKAHYFFTVGAAGADSFSWGWTRVHHG
jgi:hypothetical protein